MSVAIQHAETEYRRWEIKTEAEIAALRAQADQADFDADAARELWRARNERADAEMLDDKFRRYGR